MGLNPKLTGLAATAEADAVAALLNNGWIRLYSGLQPSTADEAVSRQHEEFILQFQVREDACARGHFLRSVKKNLGDGFRRSRVKVYAHSLLNFSRGVQQFQSHIQPTRLPEFARRRQHHPALQSGMLNAREIYGGSRSRRRAHYGFSAGLHAAHAQQFATRK